MAPRKGNKVYSGEAVADLTSFNPLKVLLWRGHLEAIAKGDFLPPVAVHIDLTQDCNSNCPHCSFKHLRSKKYMPKEHLIKLADFIKDWGVKATYIAVSGESLLHPDWGPFIYRLKRNNIEIGVVTNGSLMDEEKRQALVDCCSWVGISVDAHNKETYAKAHGVNEETFNTVINNIEKLAAMRSSLDITVKYLILPSNWQGIYAATLLTRSLGAQAIHIRPATGQAFSYPVEPIALMIDKAKELETGTFRVHAVRLGLLRHSGRNTTFEKCWASPLGAIFAADGLVYLCCPLLGEKKAVIGSHYPDPHQVLGFWGNAGHKAVIDAIEPKECPRCLLTTYQEVIEQVVIRDAMFKNFV